MGVSGSDTGHETAYPGLQAKHNGLDGTVQNYTRVQGLGFSH